MYEMQVSFAEQSLKNAKLFIGMKRLDLAENAIKNAEKRIKKLQRSKK